MESHFAKLNLDEEELIVMESCHSYIHDLLRQMGPTNAMDPRLQAEINNFPPEAKVEIYFQETGIILPHAASHAEVRRLQKFYSAL